MPIVRKDGTVVNNIRMNEPGKCLYVSYCGISPYGARTGEHQFFGGILVDCSAPKSAADVHCLEEWLRDFELPRQLRPSYGQLVIIDWHELAKEDD